MRLTEIIFILFILSTFGLLTPIIYKNSCEQKINYFIDSLNHDLHYGQSYTVTHFALVKLKFYPSNYYYRLFDGSNNDLKTVNYDKSLKFDSYITYDTIEMSHGHVNSYCYFYLSCGAIKYKITIYDKSGIIHAIKV